ncbi:MAG: arylsulfatase [Planctomycetota bacterium]
MQRHLLSAFVAVLVIPMPSPLAGQQPDQQARRAAAGFLGRTVGAETRKQPNVLFVMADDLGYGELGSFGQKKIRTPRLDRLAAQGMRLTRHYSGSPVCAPSRCVLMTGKHPGTAAVRNNKEHKPEGQWALPSGEPMMSEMLHDAGYATGAFGKWGLGPPGSDADPLARGYDRFFGYNCQRHAHSYYPDYLWSDREKVRLANSPAVPGHGKLKNGEDANDPANYARFRGQDYAPDHILAAAKAFLISNKDKPFFLYYPSVIPHLALHVPEEELAQYEGAFDDKPYPGGKGYTPHFKPKAAYAAMITRLDRSVGELLDILDELDLADDTIVVFTSDNGATHSPIGGTDVDYFESCGELRGRKGSMYEGGVRVPAIVRWPGHVEPGSASDRVTGFEDWMPTLAALCGGEVPDGCNGVGFAQTLRGEEQADREFLYREFAGYRGWQAVWAGGYKLVRKNMHKQPKTELYDLRKDPREQHDLAAEMPDKVAELMKIAAREHTPSSVFPLKAIDGK